MTERGGAVAARADTEASGSEPTTSPATADGPLAISTQGLTKRYGSVLALDGLDLDVPAGIVFGLLGPNGAGKTTTIRLLTGIATPTSGTVSVTGLDATRGSVQAELHRRIGVLDQEPRYYGWMTGREMLQFVGDLLGLAGSELRARTGETLARVGLEDAADRRIGTYSSGMRQRLGIGQAIIGRPKLLILDEPVSSLDPEGRRDLLALIGGLREATTVVLSSHVLSDVERVCERVAILDHGRLVIAAEVSELLDRFAPPAYRVEIDPGQDAGVRLLIETLGQQAWAGRVDADGHVLRVHVKDPDAAAMRLIPLLGTSGLRIAVVERERPTLEDVFLELVGRDQDELVGDGTAADDATKGDDGTEAAP
jgi:ABC-2 type transport system ATP-binding protein